MSTLTGVVADPVAAIVQYLLGQSTVTDVVANRVYGDATPPKSADFASWITVRMAGGRTDLDQLVVAYPRLEFRCYHLTDADAAALYWVIFKLLNGQNNLISNDTRFMYIYIVSAGSAQYDETFNKPYKLAYADCMVQTEKLSA